MRTPACHDGGRSRREAGSSLVIVLMVMVILLALLGAGLRSSGINLKIASNLKVGTQAFYAADAGVNVGVAQISADPDLSTSPFWGTLNLDSAYRSGPREAPGPQPLAFLGGHTEPGYALGSGTGYNTSGYVFYRYQINATGTGPSAAAREIEAIAEYGPIPQ